MQGRLTSIMVAAAVTLASSPAAAQVEIVDPADPWIHSATGIAFPAEIGRFQRGRVVEYSSDGRDASVAYGLAQGAARLTVTVYVYPVTEQVTCGRSFAESKLAIEGYADTQLVFNDFDTPPSGSGLGVARQVRYLGPATAINESMPEVLSERYLYCPPGDEWHIKYRASWDADVVLSCEIEGLLRGIDWAGNLSG